MRRTFLYLILLALLLPSCSVIKGSSTTVVKPKYHHRWYDRKKDKKTKRTRLVRVRS